MSLKTNSYNIEESYEKRLKSFGTLMLLTGIIVEVLAVYIALTVSAYLSVYVDTSFMDAILLSLKVVIQNPLFFLPIDYSIFPAAAVGFVVLIMLFVMYATEVKKIHHNINTIKGSAEWQNAIELTRRFADFE